MSSIRVGRWDCPTCGTKGILGPETSCTNCGSPRPSNVKFYLPEDSDIVTDKEKIMEAESGVDWVCGHCGAHNKAKDPLCHACGNPRDETSDDVDLEQKEYLTRDIPREGLRKEDEAGERYRRARTQPGYKRKPVGGLLKRILAVPVLGGLIYWMLSTFAATIDVELIDHRWERAIEYAKYEPVEKEDWTRPSGAYDVSSFRAIHHYDKKYVRTETRTRTVQVKVGSEKYVCGKKDMGNGYFKDKYCTRPIYENRQEQYKEDIYQDIPVYKTKYRFKIKEWVHRPDYTLKSGAKDHEARWPNANGRGNNSVWREVSRAEKYYIYVKEDDGDVHEEEVGKNFWMYKERGSMLKAKRSRFLDIWYGLDEPDRFQE